MLTVVAPAAMTASTTSQRKSSSVRAASSGENWTSSVKVFANFTPSTASLSISGLAFSNLSLR